MFTIVCKLWDSSSQFLQNIVNMDFTFYGLVSLLVRLLVLPLKQSQPVTTQ